jgi:hypothetical protein
LHVRRIDREFGVVAHEIGERAHEALDDVRLPRMEREMPLQRGGRVDARGEHRVGRLHGFHEERKGEAGVLLGYARPTERVRQQREPWIGFRQRAGQRATSVVLVLRTDDRGRIAARQAELAREDGRDERAVLLIGRGHTDDARVPISPREAGDPASRVEPQDVRAFRKAKKIEPFAHDVEVLPKRRHRGQRSLVPSIRKQEQEFGLHAVVSGEKRRASQRSRSAGSSTSHDTGRVANWMPARAKHAAVSAKACGVLQRTSAKGNGRRAPTST